MIPRSQLFEVPNWTDITGSVRAQRDLQHAVQTCLAKEQAKYLVRHLLVLRAGDSDRVRPGAQ